MFWVIVGVVAILILGVCAWADRSRRRRGAPGGITPLGSPMGDVRGGWGGTGGPGGGDGGGGGGGG